MDDSVRVFVMGIEYRVPAALTLLQALEYAGYRLVRGVGCRHGFCGACATVYRVKGDPRPYFALACQQTVIDGMCLSMLPFFPAAEPVYDIETLRPTARQILDVYSDTASCMGCNTCTKSCPQDIDVLGCISTALRGDMREAAEKSSDCVLCGLCSVQCPAELAPHGILRLCRRLSARHVLPRATHLRTRVEEIEAGMYDEALAELREASLEVLKGLYDRDDLARRDQCC